MHEPTSLRNIVLYTKYHDRKVRIVLSYLFVIVKNTIVVVYKINFSHVFFKKIQLYYNETIEDDIYLSVYLC